MGHRPERDKRITTHVALTARAFGARRVLISEQDDRIVEGVRSVERRWGRAIEIESGVAWRPFLRDFPGTKVHLTMYGLPVAQVVPHIPRDRPLAVIVGAEKVPREIYEMVDHNVGVGNQPHSEVAALAVFLHSVLGPDVLERKFPDAKVTVIPTARGKRVEGSEDEPPGS